MALAVDVGVLIASGRVYGGRGRRALLLTVYVEVVRGTPVLLQLFVLYYGLSVASSGCRRSSPRSSASA